MINQAHDIVAPDGAITAAEAAGYRDHEGMSIYLNADAEKAAVKALGEDIGFGRIIQLAHQCWDEMLEAKHGIKGHSESWTLASADLIREHRAATEVVKP